MVLLVGLFLGFGVFLIGFCVLNECGWILFLDGQFGVDGCWQMYLSPKGPAGFD